MPPRTGRACERSTSARVNSRPESGSGPGIHSVTSASRWPVRTAVPARMAASSPARRSSASGWRSSAWSSSRAPARPASGRIRMPKGCAAPAARFYLAGCPTVVATLWKVDDRADHRRLGSVLGARPRSSGPTPTCPGAPRGPAIDLFSPRPRLVARRPARTRTRRRGAGQRQEDPHAATPGQARLDANPPLLLGPLLRLRSGMTSSGGRREPVARRLSNRCVIE